MPTAEVPSIPQVCEARLVAASGAAPGTPPDLLIEVPHGATAASHFEALRRRLRSPLPEDLQEFFFVNTDAGSFEVATEVAGLLTDPGSPLGPTGSLGGSAPEIDDAPPLSVLLLRSLIPRTFIDCNRVASDDNAGDDEMTAAVPDYITDEGDAELLLSLHRQYQAAAATAFELVCGAGGMALVLHTYAPRSISVDRIDGSIVRTLRRAYAPERYADWPLRPEVDVISELADGTLAAPGSLVETIRAQYHGIGVEVAANATYRLHPATMGYIHSVRHPGRVLCMEISRACLADPFSPFEEMRIGETKVARMARPLAAALLSAATAG